jgi:hypothetical protein
MTTLQAPPPIISATAELTREAIASRILSVVDSCGMRRHGSSASMRATCHEEIMVSKSPGGYIDKLAKGEYSYGKQLTSNAQITVEEMKDLGFVTREDDASVYLDINALTEAWEKHTAERDPESFFVR